jgi:predicted NAD/FAD-dependent oxidoreductase
MNQAVLVIGAGIAGIQASIDLAQMGFQVYLVERTPSIGGRMAQLDKTFPTNDCAICILAPKMIECAGHENVHLLTYSEVVGVTSPPPPPPGGARGRYSGSECARNPATWTWSGALAVASVWKSAPAGYPTSSTLA